MIKALRSTFTKNVEVALEDSQSLKRLFIGGQFPSQHDVNKNYPRLYNHPLCPFAERARLALYAKDIKFQEVDIDLNHKPDWFLEVGGTVPVLQTIDGNLLPESDVAIEYALAHDSGIDLVPGNPKEKALLKLFLKKYETGIMTAAYMTTMYGKDEDVMILKQKIEAIEKSLSENDPGNKYLANQQEFSIVDVYLSPVLTRFHCRVEAKTPNLEAFSIDEYPHIGNYVNDVRSHPVVGHTYHSANGYVNFTLSKQKDSDLKLSVPYDESSSEDSQSLNEILIYDDNTAKPRTNENHIRVYGHYLCPFVERVYLAFHAKKLQFQHVCLDLTAKNKWHMDINEGLVPIIELPNGEIIHDSLDICQYINNNYKNDVEFYPGDEANKKLINDTIEEINEKAIYFTSITVRNELRKDDPPEKFKEAMEWLDSRLPPLDSESPYFDQQTHETMADLSVFPFVHRGFLLENSVLKEKFYDSVDLSKIPRLKRWYDILFQKYGDA